MDKVHGAGDISSRARVACYEARGHGVGHGHHDDGNVRSRLLRGPGPGGPIGEKDIDLEANQFPREFGQPLVLSLRPSPLDCDVPALDVFPTLSATVPNVRLIASSSALPLFLNSVYSSSPKSFSPRTFIATW